MNANQIIPTRIHALLDYAVGVLLLAVPYLLGFADGSPAQYVPQVLGVMTIVMSLFTRYELSVARIIPMPLHLAVDALGGALLAASPWLFGFSDRVYLPHLLAGLGELLVVVLSRTEPARGAASMSRALR
jgi:hypothetical protein